MSRNKALEAQHTRIGQLSELERKDKVRRQLPNENEKVKNKVKNMEEQFKVDLSKREADFQRKLDNISGDWETKGEDWARREKTLKEIGEVQEVAAK